jgi:bidirectional [NiFe] hydrogenase diaphorase subunit
MVEDKRLVKLDRFMESHGRRKSSLLEVLQNAQELFGYLDRDMLMHIAEELRLPPAHVFGAVTFYNFFRLQKPGQHIVTPCLGTACYVKGVEDIVQAVEERFGVRRGGSTDDGRLSLFPTRGIGVCAMAPNVVIDGEVVGNADPERVVRRIERLLEGEE